MIKNGFCRCLHRIVFHAFTIKHCVLAIYLHGQYIYMVQDPLYMFLLHDNGNSTSFRVKLMLLENCYGWILDVFNTFDNGSFPVEDRIYGSANPRPHTHTNESLNMQKNDAGPYFPWEGQKTDISIRLRNRLLASHNMAAQLFTLFTISLSQWAFFL